MQVAEKVHLLRCAPMDSLDVLHEYAYALAHSHAPALVFLSNLREPAKRVLL